MVFLARLRRAAPLVGAALALGPTVAAATPLFALQTGKDCVACHEAGRELEGKASLNPMGQAFLQCGFKFDCSTAPGPRPSPTPSFRPVQPVQPDQPVQPSGQLFPSTFNDTCRHDDTYVTVMPGVGSPSRFSFVLKNNHQVTIMLPRTATFASACGHYPSSGDQRRMVSFN